MTEDSARQINTGRRGVVVGLDDSAPSARAMSWAAEYARSTGQRLRAVHVLDSGLGFAGAGMAPTGPAGVGLMAPGQMALAPSVAGVADNPTDDSAQTPTGAPEPPAAIRQMFDSTRPDQSWTLEAVTGGVPGEVLLHEAEDAVLLVIGTGEHTGLSRLVSGSVSHYCLSHATVPITAVPAGTQN